jgi:chaperonin GroEL
VALLRASTNLGHLKGLNNDEQVGIEIVRRAIQAPAKQIAENAGKDGAVVAGEVLRTDTYVHGYDAQKDEYKDLVAAGIIDPTKVVRTALQDAASVASLLITTEAMVAERPERKAPAGGPPGGGMGGMGDMDF